MAGLGTHHKLAILTVGNSGIDLDTYASFDELMWAAAYKFCALKMGSVIELETLTRDVVVQVQRDWSAIPDTETDS